MAVKGDRSLLDAPVNEEWIGCIDFGTAYSKIALVKRVRGGVRAKDIRVLTIGPQGGARGFAHYLLPSALYVLQDRIHVGDQAYRAHARHNDPTRELFESPKQLISQVNMDLLETPASQAQDPTQRFKRRELLLLLLGYLAHRFDASLAAVPELKGRLPRLRLSRPGWSKADEPAGEALLLDLMGRAFVLARTLGAKLDDPAGLRVDDARAALDAAFGVEDASKTFQRKMMIDDGDDDERPASCIERGFVPEATAVAASAIKPEGGRGRLLTVADIGAGTSDFGAFVSSPGRDQRGVIGEYARERQLVEQAGNYLDKLLFAYLKEKNELNEGVTADGPLLARLRRELRDFKENLFEAGEITGDFEGSREEFLARPQVKQFIERLQGAFAVPFARACKEAVTERIGTFGRGVGRMFRTVHVILTGGGASLPFVRDLPERSRPADAHPDIQITVEDHTPSWLENENWAGLYPQLAVAIGGAMPTLPRQT
jgi:molecular chaperone HscA